MRFSVTSIILGAAAVAGQLGQVSASPTENWGIMCTDVNLGGTCSGFKSPSNDCVSFSGSNAWWNDKISSIQIWAPNFQCEFYTDLNCKGSMQPFNGNVYTYNTVYYNDQFSSFFCY
ncbi:hypothetical protein V8C40DRAFT_252135 [Trichoderma camerunense]